MFYVLIHNVITTANILHYLNKRFLKKLKHSLQIKCHKTIAALFISDSIQIKTNNSNLHSL